MDEGCRRRNMCSQPLASHKLPWVRLLTLPDRFHGSRQLRLGWCHAKYSRVPSCSGERSIGAQADPNRGGSVARSAGRTRPGPSSSDREKRERPILGRSPGASRLLVRYGPPWQFCWNCRITCKMSFGTSITWSGSALLWANGPSVPPRSLAAVYCGSPGPCK